MATIDKSKFNALALAIKCWVFFGFNYDDAENVVSYVCGTDDRKSHTWKHFMEKFNGCYDVYGSRAAIPMFYADLSEEYRDRLVEYCLINYAPKGMLLSQEQKQILGINK